MIAVTEEQRAWQQIARSIDGLLGLSELSLARGLYSQDLERLKDAMRIVGLFGGRFPNIEGLLVEDVVGEQRVNYSCRDCKHVSVTDLDHEYFCRESSVSTRIRMPDITCDDFLLENTPIHKKAVISGDEQVTISVLTEYLNSLWDDTIEFVDKGGSAGSQNRDLVHSLDLRQSELAHGMEVVANTLQKMEERITAIETNLRAHRVELAKVVTDNKPQVTTVTHRSESCPMLDNCSAAVGNMNTTCIHHHMRPVHGQFKGGFTHACSLGKYDPKLGRPPVPNPL